MQLDAPHLERVKQLSRADSHIFQLKNLPYNALVWHEEPWPDCVQYIDSPEKAHTTSTFGLLEGWLANRDRKWQQFRLVLDIQELAALWHLPHKAFSAPTIRWLSTKQKPLPVQLEQNREGVCLGDNLYQGLTQPAYLHPEDRATHMIVLGKTGTGKSTFLHNLIHQDIAQGHGVAVIDPHGDLIHHLLQSSIPPEREDDVVVWDVANVDYPPPLNLLRVPPALDRNLAASEVLDIFERTYDEFADTEMADTLKNALETAMVDDTPTLRDIDRLFKDASYRWQLIGRLDNPATEEFWQDFDEKSLGEQNRMRTPVLRRVRAFYSNRLLYPILCHPQNLDFFSLMRQNKIILVSLLPPEEQQLTPADQRLLGAVMMIQLQMTIMAKAVSEAFYIYVDEARRFVTTSIADLFDDARKRKGSLILANQYLDQLKGDTLKAVMGNVGAMVAFQCEEGDAKELLPYMKPSFGSEDLVQMDMHQAAIFMRFKKAQLPAFSLKTRAAPAPRQLSNPAERIRQKSIARYTPMSRAEVMAWLKQRYPPKGETGSADDGPGFYDPVE
jgi:hypothetical protein